MKKHFVTIILLIIICINGLANPALEKFLSSKGLEHASIGISIHNADNNEVILEYQPDLSLIPASTLKILSTATALSLKKPDYKFETVFGYDGVIKDGVLHGNLIIKGSGDPTMLSAYFDPSGGKMRTMLLNALKDAGIKKIEGNVISDESLYDFEGINPGWIWEDLGNYYAAGIYGVNFMDNRYTITFNTSEKGLKPSVESVFPPMPYLNLQNNLLAKPADFDSAYIYGAPFSNDRFIYGAIPQKSKKFTIQGDIPEPSLSFACYINRILRESGINVLGKNYSARLLLEESLSIPKIQNRLFSWNSPDLSDIVRKCNVKSINLYAEALMRLASPRNYNVTITRSIDSAIRHWKQKGVDVSGLFIYDGSGLSPQNRVTAKFLTNVLEKMKDDETFVSSLPVASQEGTVRGFLGNTKYAGKARVKSGTIKNVLSYSGYLNGNKNVIFTVIVNGHKCSNTELRNNIGKLLEDLNL